MERSERDKALLSLGALDRQTHISGHISSRLSAHLIIRAQTVVGEIHSMIKKYPEEFPILVHELDETCSAIYEEEGNLERNPVFKSLPKS